MELGYENAPVQQCPIAGAGPEDWSGGGGGGRKGEGGGDKEGERQNKKVENRTDIKELQAKQQR